MKQNVKTAIHSTYFSILSNLLLAFIKGISGFFGNSYALIADAIESLTDVLSSILVLLGIHYSKKPADDNHPYGHGKIEPLVTFVIVGFLIISATIIAYQSILNIQTPHKTPSSWTIYVLLGIIIWKEISYRVVLQKSKSTGSTLLKADAWHHRSDAITSIAALIGISIALFMGEGYEAADDWAALFAAAFILYNCYLIFRPALGEIMDEHQYEELETDIRKLSLNVKGILAIEKCMIRKIGMEYQVDLHVEVDAQITVEKGHYLAHQLKDYLMKQRPLLGDIMIHIEPYRA